LKRIIEGIAAGRQGGINTIIDATTFDLGRDVTTLAEVSRKTGFNIIACAGWWMNLPQEFV